MLFDFSGIEKDLNNLKYIVYVDDINDGWYGSEYILFIFEDKMVGDFSEGNYSQIRYDLDPFENKEDTVFLSENMSKIEDALGCDISIIRSVHYPFYSEVIYPFNHKGKSFYIEKELHPLKISLGNFYRLKSIIHIFVEIVTLNFFKNDNNKVYSIDDNFFH